MLGDAEVPKFTVRRRIDAYVDYVASVEADTPAEAAEIARDNEGDFKWEEEGPCEFDARGFVTLNAKGYEIDGTQVGYFG